MALFANATFVFNGTTYTDVKGFDVSRSGEPKYSAADLDSYITYQSVKNRLEVLTVRLQDLKALLLKPGDTGTLTLTAKTADGGTDTVCTGSAMVVEATGSCQFADVEQNIAVVTFSIIGASGSASAMTVT